MNPWIGDRTEPMPELAIEIVEIGEHPGEEEVFGDIVERPLDSALRFRPIGPEEQSAIVKCK